MKNTMSASLFWNVSGWNLRQIKNKMLLQMLTLMKMKMKMVMKMKMYKRKKQFFWWNVFFHNKTKK